MNNIFDNINNNISLILAILFIIGVLGYIWGKIMKRCDAYSYMDYLNPYMGTEVDEDDDIPETEELASYEKAFLEYYVSYPDITYGNVQKHFDLSEYGVIKAMGDIFTKVENARNYVEYHSNLVNLNMLARIDVINYKAAKLLDIDPNVMRIYVFKVSNLEYIDIIDDIRDNMKVISSSEKMELSMRDFDNRNRVTDDGHLNHRDRYFGDEYKWLDDKPTLIERLKYAIT